MARFVYDKGKVNTGLDYLKEAKRKLNGIRNQINTGISRIQGANGYKYINVNFSGMQSLEDNAKSMITSLEDLINDKIQRIEEYNAYRQEHPIKSRFADFSMGATSIVRGAWEGAQSIGDGALAVAGAVGGAFGNDTWKECCQETLIERKTSRDAWFNKQYESGIWSDVEKYSSYSSKSTKASVFRGVGSAVPFVAAAVATGGASAAGTISGGTALAADSTLAAYSALGERTASGLASGEDFDKAYQAGTNSAIIAGVSTFALGKGTEKIGSAIHGSKGATVAANSSDDVTKTVVSSGKSSSKSIFKKADKLENGLSKSSDDLAKAVDDLKKAEINYQKGLRSGASDGEMLGLSDERFLAKKKVQELGGDVKKVLSSTDKLDDVERSLGKARKASSKATDVDISRLETQRANASEVFKDANNFKKTTDKAAKEAAKSANEMSDAAEKLRVAERKYQQGLKNNVSADELEKLRADRIDARLAVQKNGGSSEKVAAAAKRLDDAEEALAKAKRTGSKVSQADIAKLETERDTARNVFNNVSKMDKKTAKAADEFSKAVDDLKKAEINYQKGLRSGASDGEMLGLSDERFLAKKRVQELGGDVKKVLSSTDKLDDVERSLGKARKASSKATDVDVSRLETQRANASEIFNDANNFKKTTDKAAKEAAKSANEMSDAAEKLRVAERKYQQGLKNNVSADELEKLRAERFDARLAVKEKGGNLDKITEAAKKLDDAEEAVAKAKRPGSKVSQAEIAKLETEQDLARNVFRNTANASDDAVKQVSKFDSVKTRINNAKESVASSKVGTKVKDIATDASAKSKAIAEKVSNSRVATNVKGVATDISEGATKVVKSAGTVIKNHPKLATAGAAATVVGVYVNANTSGNSIESLEIPSGTNADEIFVSKNDIKNDPDPKSDIDSDPNPNPNPEPDPTPNPDPTPTKEDRTKSIIAALNNKNKNKTKINPKDTSVKVKETLVTPKDDTKQVTPNVTPQVNNTPVENKTNINQQTVQPSTNVNKNVTPSNTAVPAHQVSNQSSSVSKNSYTGPTTVKSSESNAGSYSNYSGGGNYSNPSISSATKEIINKSKTSMGNDLGSKVKSVIGQKTIKPIVIDDTTSTTSSRGGSGAGLAVGGVVAAGAAIGLGTKAYLDKKKNSEEYEDDEIEEITQDEGYDTDSAVYEDTNNKEENDNIEMLYDDPYEANEGAAYDDSYDDLAYGEVEDLVTF